MFVNEPTMLGTSKLQAKPNQYVLHVFHVYNTDYCVYVNKEQKM